MTRQYPPTGSPVKKLKDRKCPYCNSENIYLYLTGMYSAVYFVECADCDLGTANCESNQTLAIADWDNAYAALAASQPDQDSA